MDEAIGPAIGELTDLEVNKLRVTREVNIPVSDNTCVSPESSPRIFPRPPPNSTPSSLPSLPLLLLTPRPSPIDFSATTKDGGEIFKQQPEAYLFYFNLMNM